MAQVGITAAAKLTGRNRSTIFRAIDKGLLSATRDDFGRYGIDPAELERVYGTLRSPNADDDVSNDAQQLDAADGNGAALLREIELLREMLSHERAASREALERERGNHDRERHSWDEERTFLRGMLEQQTDQVKLRTDERQQKERHSPTLWARLWRRQ